MPDLTRWLDRWNRYWFPPASTLNLAGARIVAVAAQLFLMTDHPVLAPEDRVERG